MNEKIDSVKKHLTKVTIPSRKQLVYSNANLQRKGLWINNIQLETFGYEYLYRNGFEMDTSKVKDQFKNLLVKPQLLIRSGDIRDKNDLNRAKAVAALFNLSPYGSVYNHENLCGSKFRVLDPQPSKSKVHRKTLLNSGAVTDIQKIFLTDTSYHEFVGFFIGFLIPEMKKRHIAHNYGICYDFKPVPPLSFGFWHLNDLPQLLTSTLFSTSLYDYYDWSNSSLHCITQFPVQLNYFNNEDGQIDDEADDKSISNLDYYTMFFNYFRIL
jgi:hypothetical protein